MTDAADDGPHLAFDDSRRLTGPSRWFAGPGVMLAPLGPRAGDDAAHAHWSAQVEGLCRALDWPPPQPVVQRHAGGAFLAFAAPEEALLTATEVNEWAWERCAGDGFDAQHVLRDPAASFARLAAREASRPLLRLKAAARERGVPVFEDDDAITLGAGAHGHTWPRAALPLPMDVPWPALRDIPKALVTGSNGKTTTVRLIAAMARAAGHVSGLSSTEGIVVGEALDTPSAQGDWSGPAGARTVLRDARVTLAVLETARGGIARRGLAVAQADAAVITNISADHFGEHGIDSLDDLAELKLVVARAVAERGVLVLNADDEVLMRAADRLTHAANARRALFAFDHDAAPLAALRERGGATCGVRAGRVVLALDGTLHELGAVTDLPLAAHGAAPYNVMNAAAAALAAAGLGLPIEAIRRTLHDFGSRPEHNPGRLERHAYRGATVLIDYAHNPDGLARLLAVARALPHQRLLLLLGQAGNRSDEAIAELACTAAAARPDAIVIKELPQMLRGRPLGEVPALLLAALQRCGLDTAGLRLGGDEVAGAASLLDTARSGDVVVLPLHSAAGRTAVAQSIAQEPDAS